MPQGLAKLCPRGTPAGREAGWIDLIIKSGPGLADCLDSDPAWALVLGSQHWPLVPMTGQGSPLRRRKVYGWVRWDSVGSHERGCLWLRKVPSTEHWPRCLQLELGEATR